MNLIYLHNLTEFRLQMNGYLTSQNRQQSFLKCVCIIEAFTFLMLLFRLVKTEVDPWQNLETDLAKGDDPLGLDR